MEVTEQRQRWLSVLRRVAWSQRGCGHFFWGGRCREAGQSEKTQGELTFELSLEREGDLRDKEGNWRWAFQADPIREQKQRGEKS